MASKTVVELFDDLDGGRADETVRFALDGVEYEIDLSRANAAALRDVLAEFVAHAHRTPVRPARSGRTSKGQAKGRTDESVTAEIRRLAIEAHQAVRTDPAAEPDAEPARLDDERQGSDPDQEPVRALVIPFQEAGL